MNTQFLSQLSSWAQPFTEKFQPATDKIWTKAKPSFDKFKPVVQNDVKWIVDWSIRVDTALIGVSLLQYCLELGKDSVVSLDRKSLKRILMSIGGLSVASSFLLTAGWINYIVFTRSPTETFFQPR